MTPEFDTEEAVEGVKDALAFVFLLVFYLAGLAGLLVSLRGHL